MTLSIHDDVGIDNSGQPQYYAKATYLLRTLIEIWSGWLHTILRNAPWVVWNVNHPAQTSITSSLSRDRLELISPDTSHKIVANTSRGRSMPLKLI